MSLRARLLAGMAVVSFVLVAVAYIIGRTTEANLVDRVDQQLASSAARIPPPGVTAFGTQDPSSARPTQLYVAQIQNGQISAVMQPNVNGENAGVPVYTL